MRRCAPRSAAVRCRERQCCVVVAPLACGRPSASVPRKMPTVTRGPRFGPQTGYPPEGPLESMLRGTTGKLHAQALLRFTFESRG